VICVDRGTGAILWDKQIDTVDGEDEYTGIGVPAHGYASHTPVSDGKHVFAFLGKSGVVAFDLEGNQIWQVSVGTGSDDRRWGSGSSPILYENLVIVPAIAESVAIIALDKTTGVEVWRQEADGLRSCWGTPAIVKSGDENDLVIAVPGEIWGLNPENGKLRWLSTGAPGDSCYTSVAVDNSGTIFASAGGRSGGGSVAVKGGGTGDVSETHLIWENRDQAGFGSPIVANDTMFLFSRGIATLVDAKTGKQINKLRLKADSDPAPAEENSEDRPRGGRGGGGMSGDYASPVIANGKLYYIKSNGETFVFSADPEFKQLAVNRLTDDDETFSGTPAISDSQLFLRSDKHLYCIDTNK
jgi:outer membrane protein assembly factor BamB